MPEIGNRAPVFYGLFLVGQDKLPFGKLAVRHGLQLVHRCGGKLAHILVHVGHGGKDTTRQAAEHYGTAVFTCGGYTFTAKGRTTLCEGWREIERLSRAASGEQDEDAEPEAVLPPLAEGQTFDNPAAEISERYTQPPKAFTDVICYERGIRNRP